MSNKANINNETSSVILSGQPKPITDQAAYDDYLKAKSHPILTTQRYQTASDGSSIDMSWFPKYLQSKTDHLPEAEQNKYMKLKEVYFKLQSKANGFKTKAYSGSSNAAEAGNEDNAFNSKRTEIIELFGRMFTIKEVYQIATQDWKLKYSLNQLAVFRTKNIDAILAKIEEHKRTYSDIRLGHKRSRLEELTWMYMKRKAIYNVSGKSDDHRLLLSTIEQIRKEAEGDKITLDGNVTHNIDGAVNELVEKDLTKNLSIKELILARVAAKTSVPVATLVADLSKGWYSKILNRQAEDALVEIEYPSVQAYDFDHIARVAQAEEHNKRDKPKIVAVSPEIITAGNDIKAILLAKLTQKKGDVQAEKNDLNPHFIDKANQFK